MTPATSRRTALGLAGLTLLAGAGCTSRSAAPPAGVTRHRYGRLPDQFGDLYLPAGRPNATVVVLHGGFWLDGYDLDLMQPICRALARDGWAAWNLEYRRLGSGGGWPSTFEDVAAGVDHVADLPGVDHRRVVLLGHSAGGHLAVWNACRTDRTPGGPPKVRARGVVSLAGVLDLTRGFRDDVGNGTIEQLLGGTPEEVPDHYRYGDPARLVPCPVDVAAMRGRDDDVVPESQLTSWLAADRTAGGTTIGVPVAGDHFTIIDPTFREWAAVLGALHAVAGVKVPGS